MGNYFGMNYLERSKGKYIVNKNFDLVEGKDSYSAFSPPPWQFTPRSCPWLLSLLVSITCYWAALSSGARGARCLSLLSLAAGFLALGLHLEPQAILGQTPHQTLSWGRAGAARPPRPGLSRVLLAGSVLSNCTVRQTLASGTHPST